MNETTRPAESDPLPRTAMIGVGSMGGAILAGLRAPGVRIDGPIAVTTRSLASAEQFAGAEDVVAFASESDPEANRRAVRGARLVILGVKPWMIADAVREIADALEPGAIVVSVAAGVPSAAIEALVPAGISVVRAMPNTPSHLGLGATGVAPGASADAAAVDTVRRLFETVGIVLVVHEDQINDVAAVSGSGPAYLFLYAEEMTAAAARLGFDEDQARRLVLQTIVGAAELMRSTGEDPARLRRNVTSPKGTTERAIAVLQDAGWGALFDRALAANVQRSEELERGE
ncbi:pyrroline-5-carboxylate reductase [Leucobacter triazinivorans]|uniref:Pyrroline-5-carboxylate reductase n=1 Tax=Leucobacter triazinivorans TaxID=1784719 RepID=A0A4P6KFI9_9MICO|nr:pyrroline-5-carboxylate reductase [Leucobacter triazinivorans]QBE49245.1 pyrroline-5-carboxylate reductase [Leucobacter triazinivorans]